MVYIFSVLWDKTYGISVSYILKNIYIKLKKNFFLAFCSPWVCKETDMTVTEQQQRDKY